jgi:acyl carrier protein
MSEGVPSREEVLAAVAEILGLNFAVPAEKVKPEASFRGTLGLDSLDAVDLVFFVEKRFGMKAGLHAYRELHTVGKLTDFVIAWKSEH